MSKVMFSLTKGNHERYLVTCKRVQKSCHKSLFSVSGLVPSEVIVSRPPKFGNNVFI